MTRAQKIKLLWESLAKSEALNQQLYNSMYSDESHQLDFTSKQLLYNMSGNIDNFVKSVWSPGYVSVDDYRKITNKDFVGTTVDGVTYPLANSSASEVASEVSSASAVASEATSASGVASASAVTSTVASDSVVASTSDAVSSAPASDVDSTTASTVDSASASNSASNSAVASESASASAVSSTVASDSNSTADSQVAQ